MELFVWPGDHGLPSMDLASLQIMSYCKFAGAPIKINPLNNSWRVVNNIPFFTHGYNVKLKTFKDIVNYLKRQNYNTDHKLTQKDKNDAQAYTSIITQKLEPALLYIYWAHEANYAAFIRPWYARRMPFPTNFVLPDIYQKQVKNKLTDTIGDPETWQEKEHAILEEAQKCITLLSQKLSNKNYFFGDTPTSFDAYVFGYLGLCTLPFPHLNPFKGHITTHPNLLSFISRVKRSYFPDVQEAKETIKEDESEFPNRWLDITLSSLFAASVMFTYAFFHLRHLARPSTLKLQYY